MTTEISVSSLTAPRTAAAAGPTGSSGTSRADNGTLDKQAFLELLVAQLKNQDPSSPMDSSNLMTQTTQLSSMESLEALRKTSTEQYALQMRMAGASLVGRQVSWTAADGTTTSGLVSAVSYSAGTPKVTVGTATLGLDEVTTVTTATTA
ncbi:flagellar hook assembly protein FlgD [Cellulomonas marina]|uniref:Flagellar basal-body rod modification protein FlgD n=1 Tax=Cellulomonas marina TaxID=988821 RepID=A0A1I0WJ30_9CELL|nr:flagellar hook capping FlgD N-terminal domain-containing protein [Cellulomonas marina]SFA88130.1 flagellar basal-body rod modification protein FlgD [Cellulomonas marina]